MKLRDIEFRPVFNAAGVRGFYGEGNRFQTKKEPKWSLSTFKTKSITYHPHRGEPFAFIEIPNRQSLVNAIKLDNPGLRAVLAENKLQRIVEPWVLSLATVSEDPDEREWECIRARDLLWQMRHDFLGKFAIEFNPFCPNLPPSRAYDFSKEVQKQIGHLKACGAPVILKVSIETAVPLLVDILTSSDKPDGLTISNSVRWGAAFVDIPWHQYGGGYDENHEWSLRISPLRHRDGDNVGDGALSGAREILEDAINKIVELRNDFGIDIPIIGGGGIKTEADVRMFMDAGANAVEFWTIAHYEPKKVSKLIREAYRYREVLRKRALKQAN